ncbi:MAG: ATP-binding cassette domain-containing protein [Candidatus Scalindua sp.]|jgi:osmoprotectant transport system ATP-binding protein|nr:ATP-binding cassette domain-containing protein [Candidatus Scalindua sp.]MBT5305689.1 ATP-binding cassette domain-containing protein [Candidatus Scalindua sp.]MBT6052729.1 ATP-binding cassette domain-containing protein [Candidatus Scalindua sp.]MBT6226887.1 ATP-binding cassette domain-containing protein [Candidatus Scalindua sp.]MBT6561506.1 ATP-binding cassette domain-containing protein [Candidatus Scalindua sp.]
MIQIQGVSKTYGQAAALHSIDLTIPAGQTTVFIGQSGCGKSTILRLIIGLIQADSGSVYFEGTRVTPDVVTSLRRKMGYVIQEGGLFPHLTAYDNVALMARYLGWSDERIKGRLNELSELTHFPSEGLERFSVQLSGGQQQRVSLMRALMLDPDVLLLDEPLGALDPMIRADLQVDLKRIFQALGKTVVLVTHDIAEAGFFGDVITLLKDGRVLQKGTLEELIQSPADPFVTRFINAQRSPLDVMRKDSK